MFAIGSWAIRVDWETFMNDGLWKRRAVIVLALIFLLTGCFARLKAPELNPEMAGFQGMEWDTSLEKLNLKIKGEVLNGFFLRIRSF